MSAPPTTEAQPVPSTAAENKYPDRSLSISPMSIKERNSGSLNQDFLTEFRESPFYMKTVLTAQQKTVLKPSREDLLLAITGGRTEGAYHIPNVFLLKSELRHRAQRTDTQQDDTINIEWKRTVYNEEPEEEDQQEAEEDDQEHDDYQDDEDMGGDYNPGDYIDRDGDDDVDDSDGSD